jgi:hypothetical protein
MWMLACYEEILKQKTRALPCQSLVLDFFKPSSGTRTLLPALLGNGDYDKADDLSIVQERVPPP